MSLFIQVKKIQLFLKLHIQSNILFANSGSVQLVSKKKVYNAKISLSSVSEISHSSKTKHRIRTGIVEIERAEKSRSHSDNFSKPYLYSLASYEPSKFGLRYWCCQNRCMIFELIIQLKTDDPITEL